MFKPLDTGSLSLCASQSGSAMVFVLVVAVIANIVIAAVMMTSRFSAKSSGTRREKVTTLNIAEAGKERFYAKLLYNNFTPHPDTIETVFSNESFGGGTYTVKCSTGTNTDSLTIRSTGTAGNNTTKLEIRAVKRRSVPLDGISALLPGVICARSDVDLTGNIHVDGREYDSLNVLTGDPGTYGVYTCMSVSRQGSAAIGGKGVEPVDNNGDFNAVRSTVCSENQPITSNYASPEAFLGLPEGSLDAYKISPGEFVTPFKGLVYVEGSIGPVHFGESRGILIVHDSTKTSQLKINQGSFKGLIICDEMDKINGVATIIGAVVSLGTANKSTFGNGHADVHYSSQVLDNLDMYCENIRWTMEEVFWRELP